MGLLPENNMPVGTLQELQECGMDPKQYGSCSKQGANALGCGFHKRCRFIQWRDGVDGRQGPLNVGVEIILNEQQGGAWKQEQMPCFMYYRSNLAARARKAGETGEVIRIIAYEGDGKTIKERDTVRANPADPNDKRHETIIKEHEVTPFPRPAQAFPIFARKRAVTEESKPLGIAVLDEREAAALKNALATTGTKKAPLGEPRKVEKQ